MLVTVFVMAGPAGAEHFLIVKLYVTSYLSMLVVVVSVQVMVIDVAVCMVALRLLGGLGTASVKHSKYSMYS